MKIPRRPPSFIQLQKSPESMSKVFSFIVKGDHGEKYRHWDTLRHLTPPEGLSIEEWWFAIKLMRQVNRTFIFLYDKSQKHFSFVLIDQILQRLHQIDLKMGGGITLPDPIANPHTRNDFLVRSLIEEAIASSQLEGASTTRLVAKEMLRSGRRPNDKHERMIYNNYLTMEYIQEISDQKMSVSTILELHRLVTDNTLDDSTAAGRFRYQDEQIVVEDKTTSEILHDPPRADQLNSRMQKLCDFANGDTQDVFIHPILRAIIVHFWLAYDHPFVDGNGRTARALFYWMMLHSKYWLFEFISISEYLFKAPVKYARSFLYTETDDNDLTYFLIYQLEIIERAVQSLYNYIDKKTEENRVFEEKLKEEHQFNHRQEALILHALKHPEAKYTIQMHKNSHRVAYDTARNDLLDLVAHNLLIKKHEGNAFVFVVPRNIQDLIQ